MFDYEFRVNALVALLFLTISAMCGFTDLDLPEETAVDAVGTVSCLAIGELLRLKRRK
ncbi:hypothetical protein [Streptomyces omiyaensis]|uniref:hypothetical protein n=1 Tax=Streptomyces omiyaensis TaxID=68247 RepID=UPI00370233CE